MSRTKRTYIHPETGEWVTEVHGRIREATDSEIRKTRKDWDKWGAGE